jgi:hypothetical protein
MKNRFQSRNHSIKVHVFAGNIDSTPRSFDNSPTFTLTGQDGKTILELTKSHIPFVTITMHGSVACVTGLNDVRQTETCRWVPFLNGHIPIKPVDKCVTRSNDIIVWIFMPIRLAREKSLNKNQQEIQENSL